VIFIGVPEAVLVASQRLDVTAEHVLSGADLDVIGRILERARGIWTDRGDEGLARAPAAVLVGFVREVPFREGNDAVALACVLHLLALNGWDLEAGPPGVVRERIGRIRAGEAELGEVIDWIRGGLVGVCHVGKGQGMFQRRRRKETAAYLSRFWGRFTDRARRSVALAQEEAEVLGHPTVAPEHLVLGMLRIPDSGGRRPSKPSGSRSRRPAETSGQDPGAGSPRLDIRG
jgi:hypothetical protein